MPQWHTSALFILLRGLCWEFRYRCNELHSSCGSAIRHSSAHKRWIRPLSDASSKSQTWTQMQVTPLDLFTSTVVFKKLFVVFPLFSTHSLLTSFLVSWNGFYPTTASLCNWFVSLSIHVTLDILIINHQHVFNLPAVGVSSGPILLSLLFFSGMDLSYQTVDSRGTTFTIRSVKARGKVPNYQRLLEKV